MEPMRTAVIIGSTRPGRFGPTVAAWIAAEIGQRDELRADVVDLAEPEDLTARLAEADAFVVVTPEYNHSYPGPLKAMIDGHFHEWRVKPIAFVSYGGISGGLRAVEHLRPVFAELHATTIRDTVSFHGGRACFGEDGLPLDAASGVAAKVMLDRLTWWAATLREARAARPYPVG